MWTVFTSKGIPMVAFTGAFSGMSSNDIAASRKFYEEALGLTVTDAGMGNIMIEVGAGDLILVYPKDDHVPATYTILNFEVEDIDAAVDDLASKGVVMEQYGMPHQDAKGIARGKASNQGPDIAWFLDPAGNILSVLSN